MRQQQPKHLSTAAKKLYREISDEIDVSDTAASLLLQTLCEQFDRMNEARGILAKDGVVIDDRFGQKRAHPACAIEKDAIAALTRCWRLLGFDQVPPGAIGRPAGS
jgi:P27 family predicted phage terminase small subunit